MELSSTVVGSPIETHGMALERIQGARAVIMKTGCDDFRDDPSGLVLTLTNINLLTCYGR
jgi:hypothetical protein